MKCGGEKSLKRKRDQVWNSFWYVCFLLGGVPPSDVVCPVNWQISSSEILTSRTVRLILPLYIRLISDSLFDLRAFDLSVLPVNIWCQTTFGVFRTFCKPCNNVCWTCCKLVSLVKSDFGRYNHYTILLLYSTRQNVISRGLLIFGSFCSLLRNVVTETFAEAAANC